MEKQRLLIFDIDGTLTNTKMVDDRCYKAAFDEIYGIDLSNQVWNVLKNVTDIGILQEMLMTHDEATESFARIQEYKCCFIKKLEKEFLDHPDYYREVPGASSFLAHLIKNNIAVAIATGSWSASARVKLQAISHNLASIPISHCDEFISREAITKDAIEKAKRHYQTEFDEIIYFGDGEWDYKTCKNLHLHFIGIDIKDDKKLTNLGAETVFTTFLEIDKIMATINSRF